MRKRSAINRQQIKITFDPNNIAVLMEQGIVLFLRHATAAGGNDQTGALSKFHDCCYMVNDDKPLLRVGQTMTEVCGTPWNGKHHLGKNCIVPLRAICILEQGEENEITRLAPKDALPMLMQQSYRPDNPKTMLQLLKVIDKMAKSVAFYRLKCNMDPEAAKLSYETMLGK